MRLTLPLSFLVLTGCPYIWGPPDLSNVGLPPGTGDDPPLDKTTDPGGSTEPPTADTGPIVDPVAPEVTMSAHYLGDDIELRIVIDDPDGDLEGGSVTWWEGTDAPGEPIELSAGTPGWNDSEQTFTLRPSEPPQDCEEDRSFMFGVLVTDNGGRISAPAFASLEIQTVELPWSWFSSPTNIGDVRAPAILCGVFESGDERDQYRATVLTGGTWSFTLNQPDGDVELRVGEDTLATLAPAAPTSVLELDDKAALEIYFRRPDGDDEVDYTLIIHE